MERSSGRGSVTVVFADKLDVGVWKAARAESWRRWADDISAFFDAGSEESRRISLFEPCAVLRYLAIKRTFW
jgi:hypothetical protein